METFVYVIAARPEGPVKIGYSSDPHRRVRQLQTGYPEPLTLYHSQAFEEKLGKVMEKIVHHTLGYKRKHGEWFNLTVSDAILEVEFANIRYGEMESLPRFLLK